MKRGYIGILASAISLLHPPRAFSGEIPPAQHLDLPAVIRLASERNVDAVVADQTVRQSLEHYVQARAQMLPSVQGDLSAGRQTRNLATVGIPAAGSSGSGVAGPFSVLDARISAAQRIFDLGALRRWDLMAAEKNLAEADRDKVREDVMALAATLFIDARRGRDALGTAKTVLEWTRAKKKLVRGQVRLGLSSDSDLSAVVSELAAARAQVRLLRSSVCGKIMSLNALLGQNPATPLYFDLPNRRMQVPKTPPSGAESRELRMAQKSADRAEALHRAAQADFFPQISARADYGGNGGDAENLKETYNYGLGATMPIFEGGLKQSREAEASSVSASARLRLENAVRRDQVQKSDAWRKIADANAVLAAKTAEAAHRQTIFKLTQQRRRSGAASALDVLEAEAVFSRAQDDCSEARAALDQSRVEAAHAEGKIIEWIADGEPS